MRTRADQISAGARLDRLLEVQSLMGRVSRQIGPALELQPVLDAVFDAMASLVDFKGGSICLIESGALRIVVSVPEVSPEVRALRLPVGQGLAGRAAATGETVYSPDLDNDPRVIRSVRSLGSNVTIKSYLAVPLICLGEIIGVLQVDSAEVDAFDGDDVRVLEGLATQVAGAIESARRYEQVLELERLKSDFIARVSHELRTPLAVVLGNVATLAEHHHQLEASIRTRMLGDATRAAERLTGMIEELLAVTSFEAGTDIPRPIVVDLASLLTQVAEESRSPERVSLDVPIGLEIQTDPRLLRYALGLLVDNAIIHGGDVRLHAVQAGGTIRIDVRDQGPGIPEHLRGRVFERFVRGNDHTPGMGLGLPLAKNLVSALGGRLQLIDVMGSGACFRIELG